MKTIQKFVIGKLFTKSKIITFIIALIVYLADKYLLDSELVKIIIDALNSL